MKRSYLGIAAAIEMPEKFYLTPRWMSRVEQVKEVGVVVCGQIGDGVRKARGLRYLVYQWNDESVTIHGRPPCRSGTTRVLSLPNCTAKKVNARLVCRVDRKAYLPTQAINR